MISPEQWDRFFEHFGHEAIISHAAEKANIAPSTVYARRARAEAAKPALEDVEWYERYKDAERRANDRILAAFSQRGIDGVEEPLIGRVGKDLDGVVCTVRKYSDALLIRLAQARMPHLFKDRVAQEVSGPNGGPVKTETKVIAVPAIDEGAEE